MKYLKKFETIYEYQSGPKIDDYILTPNVSMEGVDLLVDDLKIVEKYFRSSVGKIMEISTSPNPEYPYKAVYNVTSDILELIKDIFPVDFHKKVATVEYSAEEILYWSDNYDELKEKLDLITNLHKYNL